MSGLVAGCVALGGHDGGRRGSPGMCGILVRIAAEPTDRFEADWNLESPRVYSAREGRPPTRPDWETLPRVNVTTGEAESMRCESIVLDRNDDELLVEVPPTINGIMERDFDLALNWRLKTRQIFQTYFDRNYAVGGFHRAEGRAFYRLIR